MSAHLARVTAQVDALVHARMGHHVGRGIEGQRRGRGRRTRADVRPKRFPVQRRRLSQVGKEDQIEAGSDDHARHRAQRLVEQADRDTPPVHALAVDVGAVDRVDDKGVGTRAIQGPDVLLSQHVDLRVGAMDLLVQIALDTQVSCGEDRVVLLELALVIAQLLLRTRGDPSRLDGMIAHVTDGTDRTRTDPSIAHTRVRPCPWRRARSMLRCSPLHWDGDSRYACLLLLYARDALGTAENSISL
jgi:hypothetical protein